MAAALAATRRAPSMTATAMTAVSLLKERGKGEGERRKEGGSAEESRVA